MVVEGSLDGVFPGRMSRITREFAQQIARSISELQPKTDDVCDIVSFLEILGYSDTDAMAHGYDNLYDLGKQVYQIIDLYPAEKEERRDSEPETISIQSARIRLTRGLSLAFPWIASISALFVFGVSLWMAFGLPLAVVSSIIIGLFFGLFSSEGFLQSFGRSFQFYYGQGNIDESKRVIKRMYSIHFLVVLFCAGVIISFCTLYKIPTYLEVLTVASSSAIIVQRASFVLVYSIKKSWTIMASYALAITVLVATFYLTSSLIQGITMRYVVGMGVALIILMIAPVYYHYRLFIQGNLEKTSKISKATIIPSFYKPPSKNAKTIESKLTVQLWESGYFSIFATLFLAMIFSDRIVSWAANPVHIISGVTLPLVFNSVYHSGADLALFSLLPVLIIQYVLVEPIYVELTNLSHRYSVTEVNKLNHFLKIRYLKLASVSVASSAIIAAVLFKFGPTIMDRIGASSTISVEVLYLACIANVFMSLFAANSQFLMNVLDKARALVIISGISVLIVVAGGLALSHFGLEYIAYSYLASAVFASMLTMVLVKKNFTNAAVILLAR